MNISKKVKQRVIASTMPFVEEAGRSAHLASQVIQNTVRSDAVDDEKGHWVTTEEGNHMFIDEGGTPTKGNPYVLAAARGEKGPKKSKSSGSNRPTPTDHSTVEKNREQRGGIARKMHESGEIPTDVMGQLDSNNYSDKIMDRAVERGWITKEQASKIKGESQPEAAVKAPAKPNKYREVAEKMKKEAEKNPGNLYYSEMVQNYSALADAADKFDPNASEHKGMQTVMALQNAKIGDTVEIKGNLFDGTYRLENVKSPWNNKSGPAWVAQDEKNHRHAFANNPATIMSEMRLINGGKAIDDQTRSVSKIGAKSESQPAASKPEAAPKTAAGTEEIHPSPEKPQKPSLKKCKKASDAAVEEIGGEFFEKSTPDTWVYEFPGKRTAKSTATSILNSLRKNGFDAVFTTANGKVSESPTCYLWVRDPKNDYNFVEYSVYRSKNTAPGKSYISVDIKQTY